MPIRVEPHNAAASIVFSDAVPIDVAANAGGIVPVLTLGSAVHDADGNALNPLDGDQRLVACDASLANLTATIFPGSRMIRIDPVPIGGPAYAWESLDAWLSDQPPPVSMDAAALMAHGMTIAVRSDNRPAQNLPWQKVGALWIARPIAPLIEGMLDSAYLPVQGWRLELSAVERVRLTAISTLVCLISFASTLYVRRGRSLVIVATIGGCIGGVLVWRSRQDPVRDVGGSILVQHEALRQNDCWTYWRSNRPRSIHVAERPLPTDAAHAEALGVREEIQADGTACWRVALKEGLTLATLQRAIDPPSLTLDSSKQESPLQSLADSAYVVAGAKATPVYSIHTRDWPDVLIH